MSYLIDKKKTYLNTYIYIWPKYLKAVWWPFAKCCVHNFETIRTSNTIATIADDMTAIWLLTVSNKNTYRQDVHNLTSWHVSNILSRTSDARWSASQGTFIVMTTPQQSWVKQLFSIFLKEIKIILLMHLHCCLRKFVQYLCHCMWN